MSKIKKNLLMISYPFPPNASAGAVRSERFARYLPKFGWSVDVVTIEAREDMYLDKGRIENLGEHVKLHPTRTIDPWLRLQKKVPRNRFLKVVRNILLRLFSFPDHMVFWVPFALIEGIKISRSQRIDAVYTTSPPHSTHIGGMLLSLLLRIPWIADYRDPWSFKPDIYRVKSKVLKWIERAIDKRIVCTADLVITNTERARQRLLQTFPEIIQEKVVCITNGWEPLFDFEDYDFSGRQFVIMHAGTFYPKFNPYELFYALARWRVGRQPDGVSPFEDVLVVLLGSGDAKTKKVVKDLKLDDIVEFRSYMSLHDAHKAMRKAHMLWTSLGVHKDGEMSLPSKIFEYIGVRRPIIGFFPDGDAAALIRSSGTGIVFESDDLDKIIEAIYNAIVSRRDGRMPFYEPDWNFLNMFRIDNIVKQIEDHLNRITSGKVDFVEGINNRHKVDNQRDYENWK
jgi:glycosyltransferase involved in cell wall biosynthesis